VSDPTNAVLPGWYPDQNGHQRWWDGTQWTENVQTPYSTAQPFAALKAPAGTKTGTVWIWLIVLLPVLGLFSFFAIDIEGYMRDVMANPTSVSSMLSIYTSPAFLISTVAGWLLIALTIVFAVLDWRALKARGVPQPFHWGFAFLGIAGFGVVYPIGRSIVVKRRTGGGLAPLWVTIAIYVITFVVTLVWSLLLTQSIMQMMPGYLY
jgi:hypothetical protein